MLRTQKTKKAAIKPTKQRKSLKATTKKITKVAKRTNCHHTHGENSIPDLKSGVRLGQSKLSAKFPSVTGSQVIPGTLDIKPFSTDTDLADGYSVLFSYPLDFTFVCPTELLDMSENMPRFKELGVKVFGLSTDSAQSHQTWMRQSRKEGGIEGLQFPLVSDTSRDISHAMGALLPTGFATRATYILHNGNIKHASFNEPPIGRNSQEIIRLVEAIQHNVEHGEVCAAGFSSKSPKAMKPTRDGLLDFVSKQSV